jgi:hypothetical protein
MLLKAEANPDLRNSKGLTGLVISLESRNSQMLNLLLQHGANAMQTDGKGKLPLEHALEMGLED